ncbi:GNAT family N-acetyltransferase [Phyllobacterium phragmitis]|uniref:GNAT family N-acetyltransferase n=1 Tax=Phyllobacterium phragmitis TaxID=2670329 RepID=A0A2S9ILJ1_9HYPH|nr:GNAT family N-acetyltransferase [Phyllobacterium phragmitis]PRD41397.1 GNAT family N-acetyltransferase [Phyllobacterium phragmitis]
MQKNEDALTFRKAVLRDLPDIVAMLADDELGAKREDTSLPLHGRYLSAFEAIDRDPNQFLAVVEAENKIVGCLQISFIPGLSRIGLWRGQIESVRIARDFRGGGIGRKMIGWAIEQSRARNCGVLQLTTDKSRVDAHRFYKSLGFVDSHEGMKLTL